MFSTRYGLRTYKDLPRGRAFDELLHDHIFESCNPNNLTDVNKDLLNGLQFVRQNI